MNMNIKKVFLKTKTKRKTSLNTSAENKTTTEFYKVNIAES